MDKQFKKKHQGGGQEAFGSVAFGDKRKSSQAQASNELDQDARGGKRARVIREPHIEADYGDEGDDGGVSIFDDDAEMQIDTTKEKDPRPTSHNIFNFNQLNKVGDAKGMGNPRYGTVQVWPKTRGLLRKLLKEGTKITGGWRGYSDAPGIDMRFGLLRADDEPIDQTQWTTQVHWAKRELGLTKKYKCEVDYVPRPDSQEEVEMDIDVKVHHTEQLQEIAGACRSLLAAADGNHPPSSRG